MVLPLVLLLLAACQSGGDRSQARLARFSADGLYDQGQKALRSSDYGQAIRVYEALVARYPFANEARQARLDLIYSYYKAGEKESATDAADTFIRENPTHPRIDYAWYLKGLIEFERLPHTVERWMRVDWRSAHRRPRAIRSRRSAPSSSAFRRGLCADARRRMVYLRNRLADHELRIASIRAPRRVGGGSQRAKQLIEQYDGAPAGKEALRVLSTPMRTELHGARRQYREVCSWRTTRASRRRWSRSKAGVEVSGAEHCVVKSPRRSPASLPDSARSGGAPRGVRTAVSSSRSSDVRARRSTGHCRT